MRFHNRDQIDKCLLTCFKSFSLGITGLHSTKRRIAVSGSLAQYFKIVAGLSSGFVITTAGDCSNSTLRETWVVRRECHEIIKPKPRHEHPWMTRSTVLADIVKRYLDGLVRAFRYFRTALNVPMVGMIKRHLSFFSSQIWIRPRSKSISLVRMLTTSDTRSPTDNPNWKSAASWCCQQRARA